VRFKSPYLDFQPVSRVESVVRVDAMKGSEPWTPERAREPRYSGLPGARESTSRVCARHGCEVVREPRGLVWCPFGHAMHADLNAAMNILARGGGRVPERVRVFSSTPTPEGVYERRKRKERESKAEPDSPAPRAG
jgi:hypothetical protein